MIAAEPARPLNLAALFAFPSASPRLMSRQAGVFASLGSSTPAPVARASSGTPLKERRRSSTPREDRSISMQIRTNPWSFGGGSLSVSPQSNIAPSAQLAKSRSKTSLSGQNAVHRSQTPPKVRTPPRIGRLTRVLCYGDSNTAGFQPESGEHKPYGDHLAEALQETGLEVAMTCCGLDGYTAADMVQQAHEAVVSDQFGRVGKGLMRLLVDDGPVDLVVLMAGTNDIGRGRSIEDITQDILKLQTMCRERGASTMILGPPTYPMVQLSANRNQLIDKLKLWPRSVPGVVAFYDSEELVPRQQTFWHSDSLHFSALGQAELGRRLAPLAFPFLYDLCQQEARPQSITSFWQPPSSVPPDPMKFGQPQSLAIHQHTRNGLQHAASFGLLPSSALQLDMQRQRTSSLSPSPSARGLRKVSDELLSPASQNSVQRQSSLGLNRWASTGLLGMIGPQSQLDLTPPRQRPGSQLSASSRSTFTAGDEVEVYSNSKKSWCSARVVQVDSSLATFHLTMPDGGKALKVLPLGHPSVRKL